MLLSLKAGTFSKPESTQPPLPFNSIPNVYHDLRYSSARFVDGKADSRPTNSQTMDLVEDDAIVFDRICNWLYTGKLNICVDKAYYTRYGEVYATAEKYSMVNLKNYLVGHLVRRARYGRTIPPIDVVKYVYSTTPLNSPLRKLFIALYIWYMDKELWASMVSSASLSEVPDFAADLAIALGNKFLGDNMDYSVHFQGKFEDYYEDPRLLERGQIMK